jgi:hypothetical protein
MRNNLAYICEIVQRGKIKPAKYKHYISMSRSIYERLVEESIIKPEYFFIEQSAFFEYKRDTVTINFIAQYICDDMHIRILSYLVKEKLGVNPITRGGTMFWQNMKTDKQ